MSQNQQDQDPAEAYRTAVDQALDARCAVTYSTLVGMAPAMDPEGVMLGRAPKLTPPRTAVEFADTFAQVHNLCMVEDLVPGLPGNARAKAEAINERRAATVAFATDARNAWKPGEDGAAYQEIDYARHGGEGTRVIKLDVGPSGNTWEISESDGPARVAGHADRLGRIPAQALEFVPLCEAMDIGPAVVFEAQNRPMRARSTGWSPDPALALVADEAPAGGLRI